MPITRAQRAAAGREAARGQPRAPTLRGSLSGTPVHYRRVVRDYSPSPSPPPSVRRGRDRSPSGRRGRDRSPLRGRARRASPGRRSPSPPPAGRRARRASPSPPPPVARHRARASPPVRGDMSQGRGGRHGSPGRGSPRGDARRGSPGRGTSRRGRSRRGAGRSISRRRSPGRSISRRRSPGQSISRRGSPRRGSPRRRSPGRGTSRRRSPSRGSTRHGGRSTAGRWSTSPGRGTRDRSPSRRTLQRRLLDQGNLARRLEKLENKKKEKEWKSQGLEKQAQFAEDVISYNEELAIRLEMEYGSLQNPDLKDFIKKGERVVTDRLHLLKVANRFGWSGATDFEKEELGRTEKEEKLLRQIRKDQEARLEKKPKGKQKYSSYGVGGRSDNYDRRKESQSGARAGEKQCFKCQRYGHIRKDCRQRSQGRGRDDGRRGGR